ncbi:unnamed protein product [Miscanthus lutarioriparius]|uniref:C3H1-type domain-containing protein n=1 Tax=Miscanthus lutarioriparius TaxID=422564 RepID=A0A811PUT5_9POAL|nr:unnamed protein product [Miscanthus lutarioriparius]
MEGGRKRGKGDGAKGASAGGKRSREAESFQSGVGSKSKPCTKFFSTSGCPFGEGCHFLHYFPGGYQAVSKMTNLGGTTIAPPGRTTMDGPPTRTVKTCLCNKYNTAEGCKWGDKCHFAHGERELGKPMLMDSYMPPRMGPRPTGHFAPPPMANPGLATPANQALLPQPRSVLMHPLQVASSGGWSSHKTDISSHRAKLAIRDHESDTSLKNIELEGTFDQIRNASAMVSELIVSISGNAPLQAKNPAGGTHRGGGTGSNFKTKMCENFAKGSCSFGDKCHFAHGGNELRKPATA